MLKLRADIAFDLKVMLQKIPLDQLGKVDDSSYKAVTMRRKVVELLKDNNKPYEDKLGELDRLVKENAQKFIEFKAEIEAVPEKSEGDKKAELKAYSDEADVKLREKMNELGSPYIVVKEDKRTIGLRVDDEVEISLDDRHVEFLKERVDQFGTLQFVTEQDLLDVGAALGM